MTLQFSRKARVQFLAALDFMRGRSPAAAERFRRRAEQSLRRLLKFPASGAIIEEYPDQPYREVLSSPYRFFYRTEGEAVIIIAIWHTSQIPDEPTG